MEIIDNYIFENPKINYAIIALLYTWTFVANKLLVREVIISHAYVCSCHINHVEMTQPQITLTTRQ